MTLSVSHLVPASPFGGAQRVAIDLAAEQRADGINARLIAWRHDAKFSKAAQVSGVPVTTYASAPDLLKLRRDLRRVTTLHLHVPPSWVAAVLAGFKGQVVLHLHTRPLDMVHARTLKNRMTSASERAVYARADLAMAISAWVKSAWQGHYPNAVTPVEIVSNGVDIPDAISSPLQRDAFTIGLGCRLSDRKGIEEFLILAVELHRRDPSIRFRLAGDGPERDRYERQAADLGLGSVLEFLGFVTDMSAFWQTVDMSAFTSPFEPFGLRLIEPAAHGLPVAAYLNGTGSDEVAEKCRGIIARPLNDAPELAGDILALKADPKRIARLTQQGREDVEKHFTIRAMSQGVRRAYAKHLPSWAAK